MVWRCSVGKLGERLADLLAAQLESDGRPRVADRRLDRFALDGCVEPLPGPVAAQSIDRAVADDGADPRSERSAARLEGRATPPDGQERLLHHVLGRASVTQDAQSDGVGEASVTVIQSFDPLGRMGRDRADNVVVTQVHSHAPTRARGLRIS